MFRYQRYFRTILDRAVIRNDLCTDGQGAASGPRQGDAAMIDFLPDDLREGLLKARDRRERRKSRLRLLAEGSDTPLPVLRVWDNGFAVMAEGPHLRGVVDLYDGATHLSRCLIVASAREGGEMLYEFKRRTAAADRPALDFARDADAPAGLLPRA